MAKLNKNLKTLARQAGGSFKTVSDRMKIADRFAERLLKLNVQIRDIKNIRTGHIELYMKSRLSEEISRRTLQNEMSAIRALLRVAGKTFMANPAHEKLSNQALGISETSRDGTKVAIPENYFRQVLTSVEKKDEGVAYALRLSRLLGLRTEETVQSAKSLRTWQKALFNGDEKIRVVFGTKGGRPRDTTVLDREATLSAINAALKHLKENNGKLIDKPSLHTAIERYRNVVREAGLTGKYAPHSLRYAYSVDVMNLHMKNGFSKEEAQALASMDLGHGDGRGHYVARVYNKVESNE
ncbi:MULTISPECIES: integrase domain-containing protein [Enterobacteriaceae]|uniref:integrase domain-containing protein n=1 Tax=Enterobacteriaceae TaxID=543 RepID=UPI000C86C13D|nr:MULTISPECIES: integrase domain-containing protein [Enterobacteriaceae]HBC9085974.1 integrase domain-containing protein [Citrobacter koseri]AUO67255.1 DNA-binding protein [Citrobacter freundii complex sp. CFNIH2]MBJ9136113.1 integrase domain-containing protein [Citrobacter farmeri]MDQ7465352.1 integrase domain-containing protein [Salmonella enterica subsp. enterica serovar Agona]MDS4036823.1 integrase domain-containing protein [Citrobacter amalonaticus]